MEGEAELIAEQLKHTIDLLQSRLELSQSNHAHDKELANHRIEQLEALARDHETRIRMLTDSATQFKLLASLATGGGLLSLISLLKVLLSN